MDIKITIKVVINPAVAGGQQGIVEEVILYKQLYGLLKNIAWIMHELVQQAKLVLSRVARWELPDISI